MESTTRYGKHCKTNRKSLPWCALANSTSTATVKNSSSSPEKQNRKCSSTTPSANSYHPTPKARNNHKQTASGDGELWTCKRGKAEKHILLHPGTWTVVESKWSWTYAGTAQSVVSNDVRTIGGQPAIVRSRIDTSEESVRTFTFTNTKKANVTPNAESIQKNQF